MKISIIVPAYNEEKLIADSLRSIQAARSAFDRLGWESEIIVCDNNSTDRTGEIAREQGATVVFEPMNQISRARNCGAAAATGDWFIFIDADSHPSAELFADVAHQIQRGKAIGGGAPVIFDRSFRYAGFFVFAWNTVSRFSRWAAGSFIYVDAKAFRQIGGFTLNLYAAEEIDLSHRLKKLGREQGRKMVMLRRHPLRTSARKLELYSVREIVGFFAKTLIRPKHMLGDRAKCAIWYDGRR